MSQLELQHLKPDEMEKLKSLITSGFFELESGKIDINIHNGQIQNITIHQMVYKRVRKR